MMMWLLLGIERIWPRSVRVDFDLDWLRGCAAMVLFAVTLAVLVAMAVQVKGRIAPRGPRASAGQRDAP